MKTTILFFTTAILLSITGCSTISGSGTSQPISVQTIASDGAELEGVKCDMTNDEGTWFVTTPGSTIVRRSNKDLQVICRKPGVDVGTASVVSRTKGNMWGNIILGGGIGAVIDHNNGSAYEYPGLIKIFMGRANQRIEEKSPEQSEATIQQSKADSNLDASKKSCEELGIKPGTEQFGTCILKLTK